MGIVPAWFQDKTELFYGAAGGSNEADVLWEDFLQTENAASFVVYDPVAQKNVLQSGKEYDPAVQAEYLAFLQSKLRGVYHSQNVTGTTPEQEGQKRIMFTVFDILLTLMQTSLHSQLTLGDAMHFFEEKGKTYSDLMARTIFYEGLGNIDASNQTSGLPTYSSLDSVNTVAQYSADDPSKYNLGYGDITLREIANWCGHYLNTTIVDSTGNIVSTTSEKTTTVNPDPGNTPLLTLKGSQYSQDTTIHITNVSPYSPPAYDKTVSVTFTPTLSIYLSTTADGKAQVTCAFSTANKPVHLGTTESSSWETSTTTEVGTATVTADTDILSIQSAVETAFYQAEQNAIAGGLPLDQKPFALPWQAGILASAISDYGNMDRDSLRAKLSAYMQQRGAINQAESSYVDTQKSRMKVYQDKADQIKQVMDAAVSARKMGAQVFEETLQQLRTILSSLTKQ